MRVRQRYVSKELTHFIGKGVSEDQQYQLLVEILRSGWLTHPPHVAKISGSSLEINVGMRSRISENEMYRPQVICFCDVPLDDLELHMSKYSRFGVSFLKSFLIQRAVNPVFYVAKSMVRNISRPEMFTEGLAPMPVGPGLFRDGIRRSPYFNGMLREYTDLFLFKLSKALGKEQEQPGILLVVPELNPVHRFLDSHIFSFIKFFDDAKVEEDPENYYMEREWRMLGNLNFELGDVRRVILPEPYAVRLRTDIPGYVGQVSFVE